MSKANRNNFIKIRTIFFIVSVSVRRQQYRYAQRAGIISLTIRFKQNRRFCKARPEPIFLFKHRIEIFIQSFIKVTEAQDFFFSKSMFKCSSLQVIDFFQSFFVLTAIQLFILLRGELIHLVLSISVWLLQSLEKIDVIQSIDFYFKESILFFISS